MKDLYLHDRDDSHSNLYFALMRIWDFNLGANSDVTIQTLVWYGVSFNLLIFILSFFLLYKLLQLITKDNRYILATMFIYSVCTGTIACSILIREYQLQSLGFILATYIFIYACKSIEEKRNLEVFSKRNICLFSLGFAFFSLTGYYMLLYSLALVIALIVFIQKKVGLNKIICLKLCIILALTLIFTLLIDPNFFNSINKNYLTHTLTIENSGLRIYPYLTALILMCIMFLKTVFYFPVILLLTGILIFAKREKSNIAYLNILFTIAFLWSIIVLYASPYFCLKYMVASFPILITGLSYIFSKYKFRYTLILCTIYAATLCYITIAPSTATLKPKVFFVNEPIYYNQLNEEQIPYVIDYYHWNLANKVLYSKDDTKFIFVDRIPDPDFKYKKYLLSIGKQGKFIDTTKLVTSKNKISNVIIYPYGEVIAIVDNTKK